MITIKEMEELLQKMREEGAKDNSYIQVDFKHINESDICYTSFQ